MVIHLSEEQKQKWLDFLAIVKKNGADKDHEKLHLAVREYAMDLIEKNPDFTKKVIVDGQEKDRIVVNDLVLIEFPTQKDIKNFVTRAEYVNYYKQPHKWFDDAAMSVVLYSLGYETTVYLQAAPGLPDEFFPGNPDLYPQRDLDVTGLHMDLVNHGAHVGGIHWEKKDQRNGGGGDCGPRSIAQQIIADLPAIVAVVPEMQIMAHPEPKKEVPPAAPALPEHKQVFQCKFELSDHLPKDFPKESLHDVAALNEALDKACKDIEKKTEEVDENAKLNAECDALEVKFKADLNGKAEEEILCFYLDTVMADPRVQADRGVCDYLEGIEKVDNKIDVGALIHALARAATLSSEKDKPGEDGYNKQVISELVAEFVKPPVVLAP